MPTDVQPLDHEEVLKLRSRGSSAVGCRERVGIPVQSASI